MDKHGWAYAGFDTNGNTVFRDAKGNLHWQGSGRGLWVHVSTNPFARPVCKIKP